MWKKSPMLLRTNNTFQLYIFCFTKRNTFINCLDLLLFKLIYVIVIFRFRTRWGNIWTYFCIECIHCMFVSILFKHFLILLTKFVITRLIKLIFISHSISLHSAGKIFNQRNVTKYSFIYELVLFRVRVRRYVLNVPWFAGWFPQTILHKCQFDPKYNI